MLCSDQLCHIWQQQLAVMAPQFLIASKLGTTFMLINQQWLNNPMNASTVHASQNAAMKPGILRVVADSQSPPPPSFFNWREQLMSRTSPLCFDNSSTPHNSTLQHKAEIEDVQEPCRGVQKGARGGKETTSKMHAHKLSCMLYGEGTPSFVLHMLFCIFLVALVHCSTGTFTGTPCWLLSLSWHGTTLVLLLLPLLSLLLLARLRPRLSLPQLWCPSCPSCCAAQLAALLGACSTC